MKTYPNTNWITRYDELFISKTLRFFVPIFVIYDSFEFAWIFVKSRTRMILVYFYWGKNLFHPLLGMDKNAMLTMNDSQIKNYLKWLERFKKKAYYRKTGSD